CTVIHTLSLHDALPISRSRIADKISAAVVPKRIIAPKPRERFWFAQNRNDVGPKARTNRGQMRLATDVCWIDRAGRQDHTDESRSEEHTSELQSRENLV